MRIEYLLIRNFKSIRELEINDIEDVLILVGRNNAGKRPNTKEDKSEDSIISLTSSGAVDISQELSSEKDGEAAESECDATATEAPENEKTE